MLKAERLGVVLAPEKGNAKFNAGMVRIGDTVHMVYRWSTGIPDEKNEGFHVAGYTKDFVSYARLGLDCKVKYDADEKGLIKLPDRDGKKIWSQDPRIVPFEDEYILFFSVWDNIICRVGMARTKDFESVKMIGVIPTNDWDKDAFILPERVNGKIVYIHRIEPDIQIDCFDSFEDMLKPEYWANYNEKKHDKVVIKGEQPWENKKVGGSIPPIKTEKGWLFIYHGVADDRVPFCYRAGAALLDLNDPSKVVARLPYPILEPNENYEIKGDVDNVVFPQGMYRDGDYLYISYGAADKCVAMCRINYNDLMNEFDKYRL